MKSNNNGRKINGKDNNRDVLSTANKKRSTTTTTGMKGGSDDNQTTTTTKHTLRAIELITSLWGDLNDEIDDVVCEEVLRDGDAADEQQIRIVDVMLRRQNFEGDSNTETLANSLAALAVSLRAVLSSSREESASFWERLKEDYGLAERRLTVICYCLMGMSRVNQQQSRSSKEVANRAASVYLLLMRLWSVKSTSSSSSSSASASSNKYFNPLVLRRAVNLLLVRTSNANNWGALTSNSIKGKKRGGKQRVADVEMDDDADDGAGEASHSASSELLLDDLKEYVLDENATPMKSLLEEIHRLKMSTNSSAAAAMDIESSGSMSSSPFLSAFNHCIEVLTAAARAATTSINAQAKCYEVLSAFLSQPGKSTHSNTTSSLAQLIPHVLKNLLPNLLGMPSEVINQADASLSATIPRHLLACRSAAIKFTRDHVYPIIATQGSLISNDYD